MDRLACVELPAFALQIALRARPQWRREAVAVLERDAPTALILGRNLLARRTGVEIGMRYTAGLALCASLRSCVVSDVERARAIAEVLALLRRFSPAVEPARDEPGTFWLGLAGLERLRPSLASLGRAIQTALRQGQWHCAVVIGWGRFETFALAKGARGTSKVVVCASPQVEREAALAVPLSFFVHEARPRKHFAMLAIRTVGDFMRLPTGGLFVRYGAAMANLHRLASGTRVPPLDPEFEREPLRAVRELDFPVLDLGELIALIEELAQPLFAALEARNTGAAELALTLALDRGGSRALDVRAATPTLEWRRWARLLELHLARVGLPGGAARVELLVRPGAPAAAQAHFFADRPRRDPRAAVELFGQLRARLGDDVVVRAELVPRHLPEASFTWERMETLPQARPRDADVRRLVRRLHTPARLLGARPKREPEGWFPLGIERGPVVRTSGPYRVSGGWWQAEVRRDGYFVELQSGELAWIYRDAVRRRWCWLGGVA